MPLKLIQGGNAPKPYRRRKGRPLEPLVCPKCDAAIAVKVKLGMVTDGHKAKGGSDAIACAVCLMKGELTILA